MVQKHFLIASYFVVVASLTVFSVTAKAEEHNRLPGFYLGAYAGMAVLDSTVIFPATDTRPEAKYVDQGGDGPIFGLRAGWGTMLSQHIYLGAEAEASFPYNVTSRLMALGVEYRARLRSEFGMFGRIGWSPDGNSLVFLRGGLSIPRQNFESVTGGNSASTDWTLVPTFGIGAETHITTNVLLRVDIAYSWPTGINAIESYRLTTGIAWRF